jgi:hypothetical protein
MNNTINHFKMMLKEKETIVRKKKTGIYVDSHDVMRIHREMYLLQFLSDVHN